MSEVEEECGVPETESSHRESLCEQKAREIVQAVVENALEIYQKQVLERTGEIDWPTGQDFTVEKAIECIDRLVKTWKIGESWKYCIDHLYLKNNLNCFCVKYSEPTRRKPVPKATASIYFYVLKYNKELPVLVLYALEGQRLVHKTTDTVLHEVWLRNVIKNKLGITGTLNLMAV